MSTVNFYTSAFQNTGDADIDYGADSFKILLVTSSYTFSGAHDFRDDITNEVVGTNYTLGGNALTSVTWASTSGEPGFSTFDAADTSFANVTLTARGAVIYKVVGSAATDRLVLFYDFGQDRSAAAIEFKIKYPSTGIFRMKQG